MALKRISQCDDAISVGCGPFQTNSTSFAIEHKTFIQMKKKRKKKHLIVCWFRWAALEPNGSSTESQNRMYFKLLCSTVQNAPAHTHTLNDLACKWSRQFFVIFDDQTGTGECIYINRNPKRIGCSRAVLFLAKLKKKKRKKGSHKITCVSWVGFLFHLKIRFPLWFQNALINRAGLRTKK